MRPPTLAPVGLFEINARTLPAVALAVWVVVFALGSWGCSRGSKGVVPDRTDPATALSSGAKKDSDIETEANGILANPADSAFVTASANRILDVLRLSPWAKTEATIKALAAERDAAIDSAKKRSEADAATIAKLTKELTEAEAKFHRTVRLWLAFAGFVFGALTIAGGIMFAKFAVLFSWFGRDVLILTASLSGLAWFTSLAYGWAVANLNWIMGGAAFILVGVGFLIYANIRNDRMDKKSQDISR